MLRLRFPLYLCLLSLFAIALGANPAAADDRVFELRVYTSTEGRLDDLEARFRDHTIRIFAKHNMEVVAFWTPTDEEGSKNTLIYILAFASQEARDSAWKAFGADPEWQKVAEESGRNGRILAGLKSTMMAPTDYSPMK